MKPVPVVFHVGPLPIHTYGVGLSVTFLFAYWYFARRLRAHGYPAHWLEGTFVWVIVAAVVGARVVHVLANLGAYAGDPLQVFAVWQGGLSSFGGLALAVPVGLYHVHRRCPTLSLGRAVDLVAPVLVAGWAIGRLLGPQLMIAGGGHPTHAWFGMYYAGEVGKRLPVPLFQSAECAVIFLVVLRVERAVARRHGPVGVVAAAAAGLWGVSRFFDERLWLAYPGHPGALAVEVTALTLAAGGLLAVVTLLARARRAGGEALVQSRV